MKNLYTTTLNGGNISLGQCQSNNFKFYFNNTQLTNTIPEDITFELNISEPLKTTSSCNLLSQKKEFDLECIIKGNECLITDPTLLKIEEITSEIKFDLIRPNALYINNFINKKIINLKAGTISKGLCKDNIYEFYFIDTQIISNLKEELPQDVIFTLNLKYPDFLKAKCTLPKNVKDNTYIDLYCFIEGNDGICPLFYYTYIEIGEIFPSYDDKIIYPNLLNFSGLSNQKLNFDNYYLEIKSIMWDCSLDSYDFNLTAKFKTDITEDVAFDINVTNDKSQNISYICSFHSGIMSGNDGTIYCIMGKKFYLENSYLTLNFDLIYSGGFYIINNSTYKTFTKNNVNCPYFYILDESSSTPSIDSTDKSMKFSLKIDTSLKNKEMKIYDKNERAKRILALQLKPSTRTKYYLKFLYLSEESKFSSECQVPDNTKNLIQINCTAKSITDTKSAYFEAESSDIIEISGYRFGINNTLFKNPFKKDDDGNNNNNNNNGSQDSMSTAGKIVLIIFIILIFVAIILALLYYFCFYRKKNRATQASQNIHSGHRGGSDPQNNGNNKVEPQGPRKQNKPENQQGFEFN